MIKESLVTRILSVYENEVLAEALRVTSYLSVLMSGYTFVSLLLERGAAEPFDAVKIGGVSLIAFLLVSLLRRVIDLARPYDLSEELAAVVPKTRQGRSFPSRHATCAFVIATTAFLLGEWTLAGLTALFGVLMCLSRVLLGYHFPRDVLVGALFGVFAGAVGTWAAFSLFS